MPLEGLCKLQQDKKPSILLSFHGESISESCRFPSWSLYHKKNGKLENVDILLVAEWHTKLNPSTAKSKPQLFRIPFWTECLLFPQLFSSSSAPAHPPTLGRGRDPAGHLLCNHVLPDAIERDVQRSSFILQGQP